MFLVPHCAKLQDLEGFSLGENYPGHYYHPVKVCACCAMVYGLIEQERKEALDKIERAEHRAKLSGSGILSPSRSLSSLHRVGAEGSSESLGHGGGSESVDLISAGAKKDSPAAEALALAVAAIDSVTKSDVSEIRSFRHPPPAVTMVTSAVMILLDGAPLPWDEAKR